MGDTPRVLSLQSIGRIRKDRSGWDLQGYLRDMTELAQTLERELAAYQQAEMPREPHTVKVMRQCEQGLCGVPQKAVIETLIYIDALRARLARVTVERNEAKEAQERAEVEMEEIMRLRDNAEDAIQDIHIALGGGGEWKGKLPPENPPDSGDLKADTPVLAKLVLQRAESAERKLAECEKDKDKLPEKMPLPCSCYTEPHYEGCECGNYDDAHSQGYAQGWNDAIVAIAKESGHE